MLATKSSAKKEPNASANGTCRLGSGPTPARICRKASSSRTMKESYHMDLPHVCSAGSAEVSAVSHQRFDAASIHLILVGRGCSGGVLTPTPSAWVSLFLWGG